MTCDTCKKKKTCTELCEEAEKYVNQDNGNDDVLSDRKYVSLSITTNINYPDTLAEIEERKTQELLFYFQKIHTMKDNPLKAITAMIFVGIPIPSIARYLKIDTRQVYRLLGK
jgi:hypothetical protein